MSDGFSEQERAALESIALAVRTGNHFTVLGVTREVESRPLRDAYFELSRKYHPDLFFRRSLSRTESDLLEEVFTGINRAYETLSNAVRRAAFERELRERSSEQARSDAREKAVEQVRRRREPAPVDVEPAEIVVERPKSRAASPPPAARPVYPGADRHRTAMDEAVRRARENLAKARRFFEAGMAEMAAERWVKAAGSIRLASELDPRNEEYKEALRKAAAMAARVRAELLVARGEQAESFHNVREAIGFYQQACDLDPANPKVLFRLGKLLLEVDNDERGAVNCLRQAVLHDPTNVTYHMELANLYLRVGLGANAARELRAVLDVQPDHSEAKEALRKMR